eukprot:7264511-Pyramimonas_sp.AAC.1
MSRAALVEDIRRFITKRGLTAATSISYRDAANMVVSLSDSDGISHRSVKRHIISYCVSRGVPRASDSFDIHMFRDVMGNAFDTNITDQDFSKIFDHSQARPPRPAILDDDHHQLIQSEQPNADERPDFLELVERYTTWDRDELVSTLAQMTSHISQKNDVIRSLRRANGRLASKLTRTTNQLDATREQLDTIVQQINVRGSNKRRVSAFGGYSLAIRRNYGQ